MCTKLGPLLSVKIDLFNSSKSSIVSKSQYPLKFKSTSKTEVIIQLISVKTIPMYFNQKVTQKRPFNNVYQPTVLKSHIWLKVQLLKLRPYAEMLLWHVCLLCSNAVFAPRPQFWCVCLFVSTTVNHFWIAGKPKWIGTFLLLSILAQFNCISIIRVFSRVPSILRRFLPALRVFPVSLLHLRELPTLCVLMLDRVMNAGKRVSFARLCVFWPTCAVHLFCLPSIVFWARDGFLLMSI